MLRRQIDFSMYDKESPFRFAGKVCNRALNFM